jgi:hypothetical protein
MWRVTMARGHRDDQCRGKFRLIEFDFEGGNASIQESLRSIAAALRTNRDIPIPAAPALPAMIERSAPLILETTAPREARVPAEPDHNRSKLNSAPKSRSKTVRSPEVVDLDLTTGSMSLEQFCQSKNPDADHKKYAVIAFWLKKYRNMPVVTADHIHTCYLHMNWHTPRSPAQPLRDLKSRHRWFNKGEGVGEYAINHIGDNEVSKMGD